MQGATAFEAFVTTIIDGSCWPFLAFRQLRAVPAVMFDTAAQQAGRSRLRHFLATWWFCARFGISPSDYHNYALHRTERRRQAGDFLFAREYHRIYARLFERADASEIHRTDNKLDFCRLCALHGLQSPHILALAVDGAFEFQEPRDGGAWNGDIIMKPQHGSNGSGFYRWQRQADGSYVGALGESMSTENILAQVLSFSKQRPTLVQKRLVNDPQTARLSGGALATVRVVTGRHANGEIEVIAAAVKMPVGNSLVDNYMRGNVLTQVDASTGLMLTGLYYYQHLVPIDRHPDTGEMFTGRPVPQWTDITRLAKAAHALVPSLAVVAFDVAPTTDGPVIVEANTRGDLSMVQYPNGRPIGQTAYTRVVLAKFGL